MADDVNFDQIPDGDPLGDVRALVADSICSISWCKRQKFSSGMCAAHNLRKWRGQDLDVPFRAPFRTKEVALFRNDDGHKLCIGCEEWKPENNFQPIPAGHDKLDAQCRNCRNIKCNLGRHGITLEEYQLRELQQGGVCACCKGPKTDATWCIDHDHTCCPGRYSCGSCIRGLLCRQCNSGIALLGDNIDGLMRAVAYLMESENAEH